MSFALSDFMSKRWMAAPLAIWGKLPTHGDFLRHRCTPAQAHDWQAWVGSVWNPRPASQADKRPLRAVPGETGWLTLEPRKVATDLGAVPVAFVMPPGALPFSPAHCVQGVMLASEDQVGRPCPLIIFQQIAPAWLRRTWSDPSVKSPHDMLYWLARIAARTHAADKDWEALTRAVDSVWQAHAPGWRQWVGATAPAPGSVQLDALLRSYCAQDTADVARGLQGVRRMPWATWPEQILRADKPAHAFWQQDMRGGYVNAGESLPALWGART
jgi:type VI secretion system protein ImpM